MSKNLDQLGNKISIVPFSDVLSISGNNFSLSSHSNFRSYYTMNDLDLDQKPNTTDAGELYTQNLLANVKNNNELTRFQGQDLLILLYTLSDKIILWGSREFPVRCKITPHIVTAKLELSRSSPSPLCFDN